MVFMGQISSLLEKDSVGVTLFLSGSFSHDFRLNCGVYLFLVRVVMCGPGFWCIMKNIWSLCSSCLNSPLCVCPSVGIPFSFLWVIAS